MQEFRREINQQDVWKDKKTKKFYIWIIYRLPSIRLLHISSLLTIIIGSYQIFHFGAMTGILIYQDILWLIIFFFFIFGLTPRIKYFLSQIKSEKAFGNTYTLIITRTGYQVNQHSFSWKKKKLLEKGV